MALLQAVILDGEAHLEAAARKLEGFLATMETRFEPISTQLFSIKARSMAMLELSGEIGQALAGTESQREAAALETLLDELKTHYRHERASIEEGIALLGALTGRLEEASAALRELLRKGKQFGLLSTFIRIEASAIAERDSGFEAIAAEVEHMATDIQHKLTQMMELVSRTGSRIARTLDQARRVEKQEEQELGSAVGAAREALSLLSDSNEKALQLLSSADGRFVAINQAMDEVVTSVQFHDITRQRLEHVVSSLQDLRGELTQASDDHQEVLGLVGDVVELEIRQIRDSRRELVAAVDSLVAQLVQVRDQAEINRRAVSGLVQTGESGDGTLVERVEAQLGRVMALFEHSAAAEQSINGEMHEVNRSVIQLTGYIDEIEDIGLRIENVALNAFIKSSRAGTQGAALGVVASQIQRLSVETQDRINRILAVLHEASAHVGSLTDRLSREEATNRQEVEQIAATAQDLLGTLDHLQGTLKQGVESFQEADAQLASGLAVVGQAQALACEAQTVLESACHPLSLLDNQARARFPVGSEGYRRSQEWIAERMARYTMHKERQVAVLGGAEPFGGAELGEFDAGIELF